MSDVTINVTVTQGGTIDADLENATVINTEVETGGQIASTVTPGGKGDKGDQGDAATIEIGTVTTVDPSDPATVTNIGTVNDAIFDFDIPKGDKGDTGDGVPDGGTTAQVLRKINNTDQNTEWHTPVKADVGLSNVDNTSDANKPVSSAQQTALDGKQNLDADLTAIAAIDSSVAGALATDGAGWIHKTYAQLKTALGLVKADVGLGNVDNTSDANKPVSTATQTALDAKVTGPASVTDDLPVIFDGTTGKLVKSKTYAAFKTLLALVKGDVGLGNVDNTSDVNKPVSTAQAAADAAVQAASQPLDSDLTTIAGLTATTDNFMVATASAWASRTPSQARSQMGLGSIALLSTITEADITLADNTTNNFSTTKHGFVPKGTNTGSFLKDDGTWAAIPGGGDMLASTYDPATIAEQLVGLTAAQTLTNKTLTSPKINENVAVTATATELNVLDGIPATLTPTELGYVDGVTSAIQTQINGKQPLDSDLTTIAGLTATTDNFMVAVASAWASRTPAQVAATLQVEIGKLMYPVGCIYTSVNSTNPNTSLGFGTWTAFGAGRVPVGFDSGQTEFDVDEETGGAKTHTLITAEIPSHSHVIDAYTGAVNGGAPLMSNNVGAAVRSTQNTGGGGAHNNLQPYIVVRMWKRTA